MHVYHTCTTQGLLVLLCPLCMVAYACAAFGSKWQLYLRYRVLFCLPEGTRANLRAELFERNISTKVDVADVKVEVCVCGATLHPALPFILNLSLASPKPRRLVRKINTWSRRPRGVPPHRCGRRSTSPSRDQF